MFGPLPRLYRLLLIVVSVVVFLGVGVWVGHLTVVPVPLPVGALLGALAGVLVAWGLVHAPHPPQRQAARRR
jgi:hypothetical protein